MSVEKRYLELLCKSLLNELYIENDVRMLYVIGSLHAGQLVQGDVLRNIRQRLPELVASVERSRSEGSPWWNLPIPQPGGGTKVFSLRNFCDFTHSMIGRARMKNIEECLDTVRQDRIRGDLLEAGVWRGGATVFMRGYLAAYDMDDRTVWVADSFEGLPTPRHPADLGFDFSPANAPILAVSLEEVQALFRRYDLLDERVQFLKGWFRDTLPAAPVERLAMLRVDGDLYESTMDALEALYARVSPGGFVLIDDYGDFAPCRQAVDDFRSRHAISNALQKVDWSGVYWRKN
jgi:O-methyltransferase